MSLAQSFFINEKLVDQFGYRVLLIKDTNNSKAEYGFTTYVQRFSLYEGMFSKFMYAEVQLYDGAGFIQKVGLQAGDILRIFLYKDPDDELKDMVHNDYYVESISSASRLVGSKGMIYTLRAVSKIGFVGLKSKLKRTFANTATSIVKTLSTDFFELPPDKIKDENLQDTYGEINISATSMDPFLFIERLNAQAMTSENRANDNNFFFFETRDGIVYKSLRKIVSDANTFNYIVPVDKNRDQESKANDFFRVLEFEVKQTNEQRKMLEEGVLENQTLTFDFISRKIEKNTFKLKETYRDILLLGEHLAFDQEEIDNLVGDEKRKTDEEQNVFIRCGSTSYDQVEDYISRKRGPSLAQYNLMNQTVVSCRVHGNPRLKPGDKVNLKASQPNASEDQELDWILTGDFLVGSVKHVVLDAKSYDTIVDLFKDGYERDISQYRRDVNSNLTAPKQ